jgi:protein with PEP-CTERM/exosortase system signal
MNSRSLSKIISVVSLLWISASASATELSLSLTADNDFSVYLSTSDNTVGTLIGSGTDWPTTYTFSAALTAGTDYFLHIDANNQGGPDGLLGSFGLSDSNFLFENSQTTLVTGTTDWAGNNTGFNGSYSSSNISDFGANGVGPWGYHPAISADADWIWYGQGGLTNDSYFSTEISAQSAAAVPDGGTTLGLLGLSLLGLVTLRRKFAR